jgi:hypothetical protein
VRCQHTLPTGNAAKTQEADNPPAQNLIYTTATIPVKKMHNREETLDIGDVLYHTCSNVRSRQVAPCQQALKIQVGYSLHGQTHQQPECMRAGQAHCMSRAAYVFFMVPSVSCATDHMLQGTC